jgi:hypothetical protein
MRESAPKEEATEKLTEVDSRAGQSAKKGAT